MYPLNTDAPWPRNQWYAAGFSADFGEVPIERTILGEKVLLFRAGDGEAVALAGLCPHRFMPLVKGTRTDDSIECAYHGMSFARDGTCIRGPGGCAPAGRLRRYPVSETGPLVWLWTGDSERADPDLLPDLSLCGISTDGWRADPNGMMHFDARYMLMIDNLFDLTHIAWVHQSLLGKPSICLTKPSVDRGAGMLSLERRETTEPDPFFHFLFPGIAGPVESLLATHMLSPGLITAQGPAVTEAEGSPLAGKYWGSIHFVHVVTPETERSTNIFSVVTRDFRLDDHALSGALCGQNKAVLAQDKDIAEAIELALASAKTSTELSFRTDRGGIEARRIIQSLIAAEAQPAGAAADHVSPARLAV